MKKKNQWKAWLYLLPALIILAVFTVWPIINTLRMALLNDYNAMQAANGKSFEFGFQNFVKVAQYRGFVNCLGNTMLLCVITVPISTMLALLIAVALNSIKFVKKAMQTIFFLPYVTNSIAIGMVFMAMFTMIGGSATEEPISIGIINSIIEAFGGTRINWVNAGSSKFANMVVLVIYIVWNALPFKILVLLGGLQSVNKQYYGGEGGRHLPFPHLLAHHRAAFVAYDRIRRHHGLYRRLQGIFERRGYLRRLHGTGGRKGQSEHHRRIHLRQFGEQSLRQGKRGGIDTVCDHFCRYHD